VGGGYKLYLSANYELKYFQLLKQYHRCDEVFSNFYSEYQKNYKQLLTIRDYCIVLFSYILIQVEKPEYEKALAYTEQMLSIIKKVHYSYEIAARTTKFLLLFKLEQYDKAENAYRSLKKAISDKIHEDPFLKALLQLCKVITKTISLKSKEVQMANEVLQATESRIEIFGDSVKKGIVEALLKN
jgi:tetratricopeptide (TPR) repeat protein